jgi:predicted O-linked N-acetylglucosamine transferase (SPINDLY family)
MTVTSAPIALSRALEALQRGDLAAAEHLARNCLADTGDPRAAGMLGALMTDSGRADLAVPLLEPLAASDPLACSNLGVAYYQLGRLEDAMRAFHAALGSNPDWIEARNNLGSVLLDLGFPYAAVEVLREVLHRPGLTPMAFSNLLLAMQYLPEVTRDDLTSLHRRFGEALAVSHPAMPPASRPRVPGPLRVGLVSGDLRHHPVGMLLEGVLPAFRECGWWLGVYSSRNGLPGDPLPARLQTMVDQWADISGADDASVAAQVRADRIDVLLDLSGHTGYHRLGVFAHRPAPFQASWLGYGDTTGLTTMDALISDAVSSPPGSEAGFTERIIRLPLPRLPFTPPADASAVQPGPCARGEAFTFGCFNNIAKINPRVMDAWARILTAAPGSRLLLKGRQFHHTVPKQAIIDGLGARGVAAERIVLEGYTRRVDYYEAFQRVDVALDPFPFNGGMSTLDALWMGVPVLSISTSTSSGYSLWARQGEMVLGALKLDDWLASDVDDYVAKATQLATDAKAAAALAQLRTTLRDRVARADFAQPARFAKAFVAAIEGEVDIARDARAQGAKA